MANPKSDRTWTLVIALVIVALFGLVLLVGQQYLGYSGLAFELLAYGLSIVALILAVLSVINGIRQGRVMKRIVHDVHKAVTDISEVADTNEKIRRKLSEDHHMNRIIAEVLGEYGLGEDQKTRQKIARRVSRRLKKSSK